MAEILSHAPPYADLRPTRMPTFLIVLRLVFYLLLGSAFRPIRPILRPVLAWGDRQDWLPVRMHAILLVTASVGVTVGMSYSIKLATEIPRTDVPVPASVSRWPGPAMSSIVRRTAHLPAPAPDAGNGDSLTRPAVEPSASVGQRPAPRSPSAHAP